MTTEATKIWPIIHRVSPRTTIIPMLYRFMRCH